MQALMVNQIKTGNRETAGAGFLMSAAIGFLLLACSESDSLKKPTYPIEVLEGYTVEMVAGPDLLDFPMFATLDETGRLFVFESIGHVYEKSQDAIDNPQFRIKLLQDLDGDGRYEKSTIFADRLSFPQGGVFYKGSLYASAAPDLLKLTDTDGDGVADEREVLLSGWILNVNANSLIGPFLGPDGWLYMTSAIMGFDVTSKEGERLKGETARIWRVKPDGSDLNWVAAGGMNNPVELTFTNAGEVIGTQTFFVYPQRGLRDALTFWVEGGAYGKNSPVITRDNLTLTGDLMPVVSQYSRVAPSGIGVYRSSILGEDFQNNLFSAQFNTHRVIRHKLLREGASFRTEDEVFFWTENENFHPTDVLEDADGSLLVVETGGWFILGCPLSQVSKPQLKGAIYRIRRQDAAAVEDPYGNQIQWESIESTQISAYLEDARPFVSDRATQTLVDRGSTSISALTEILQRSTSADARTKAVFALYRIGTADALASVRLGLGDDAEQVRVAAARSAGLAGDRKAVELLVQMVREDLPAVRRQVATALGQIGDERAISALLEAAAGTDDRFIRHAVIYALITLNQPGQIASGLEHSSPDVRQTALIALDQMPGSPVNADQLTPFLESGNGESRQTALWVASHHPEWSKALIEYLGGRLGVSALNDDEAALFGEILKSFCGDPDMQAFMVNQIKAGNRETTIFLMENMANCQEEEFPAIWSDQLARELTSSTDPTVKKKAVELVRLRGLTSLEDQLLQLADDEDNPAGLRVETIGALLESQPDIQDRHFAYLYDQLLNAKDSPVLMQVATTLDQAELSEEQLWKIVNEYLRSADNFVLPRLVPLFQGAHDIRTGKALATLLVNTPSLDNFTEENLRAVFADYSPEIRTQVDQLIDKLNEVRGERLERLELFEGQIGRGDEARGRELYFGKATCWTCHTLGEEGGNLGPDLTSIQSDRSVHDILEAVLYPSVSFVREFETYQITTKTNQHTGIIEEQNPQAIVLGTAPQTSIRIPRGEIIEITNLDVSLMPQGLDQLLTDQEFADLMAFLLGEDLNY